MSKFSSLGHERSFKISAPVVMKRSLALLHPSQILFLAHLLTSQVIRLPYEDKAPVFILYLLLNYFVLQVHFIISKPENIIVPWVNTPEHL